MLATVIGGVRHLATRLAKIESRMETIMGRMNIAVEPATHRRWRLPWR